jgi:phosphoribosyl-dephospho-CoA transferase
MQPVRRHDLLVLTPEARARIGEQIRSSAETFAGLMADMFKSGRIPAIVRRHSPCDQTEIGVGISFPHHADGQRLRFATAVFPAEIVELISPYALVAGNFEAVVPPLRALRKIKAFALVRPGNLGVYGASALQVVTGMSYVHDRSDLDLIIRGESVDRLRGIDSVLSVLEREMAIKIDVEVVLGCRGEVKLKELCSRQKTVLVKSVLSVGLVNKEIAVRSLPAD